jgi:hypothetical protein
MTKQKDPLNLAKWKFAKHRAQSKYRNIQFNFTFNDWYSWWLNHGVDKNINVKWTGSNRPCMCRTGDTGPYQLDNVYFATNSQNAQDGNQNGRSGGQFQYNYRWGNQLVSSTFLIEQNICKHNWFKPDVYDLYNKKYSEILKHRYYKADAINYWLYNNQRYQTQQQVAQAVPCRRQKLQDLITAGTVIKCRGRWDISLEDYVKQNSYFPDPFKVW